MPDDLTNQRIVLSRYGLARYEEGAIDDAHPATLGLVHDEIRVLREIIAAHPEKALTLGALVRRWEALGERLKARAH